MSFRKGSDGKWYGTIECLLIRVVGDETETVIGTRSPWGGIMGELEGTRFVEKPAEWWEKEGFTITMPEIWHEARARSRARPRD
ncbi:hypothetical protein J2Y46_002590 [Microbacterium sp. BE35]|uniref:hypothetical protein n=1 Tax=Microbacterium sp. BE35 TaxID=2817773 RepID=UPI00285EF5DB|nr:hypothetical protein [Microbacterium sp. BE35]MDR7189764.1 hypothetical protein [Microbacterium sp. BE35]